MYQWNFHKIVNCKVIQLVKYGPIIFMSKFVFIAKITGTLVSASYLVIQMRWLVNEAFIQGPKQVEAYRLLSIYNKL